MTVPYYLNIAPNYDLTLEPRYMSKRGIQMRSEFRYLHAGAAKARSVSSICRATTRPAARADTSTSTTNRCSATTGGFSPASRRYRTTRISRISAAASASTSQTHLNRFVDLGYFAPYWSVLDAGAGLSDHRHAAHRGAAALRALAADGVQRPLARPALAFDSEHRARELRSQRRRHGLAARFHARGQHAVRALGHVSDAGRRAGARPTTGSTTQARAPDDARDPRPADREPRHGHALRARDAAKRKAGCRPSSRGCSTCTCRSRTRATCRFSTRSCPTSTSFSCSESTSSSVPTGSRTRTSSASASRRG